MKLETFSKGAAKWRLARAVPSVYLDTTLSPCLHTCKDAFDQCRRGDYTVEDNDLVELKRKSTAPVSADVYLTR